MLTVLDRVCWRGQPVVGERPRDLLAALAAGGGQAVPDERLVEVVWREDEPGNAGKALQVLVSRTRAQCGPDAVVREAQGYRLGIAADQVDALRLRDLTERARRALAVGDLTTARDMASEGLALAESLVVPATGDDHPLSRLRRDASRHSTELTGLLGRALSLAGEHALALPRLADASGRDPSDEAVLACLLRSEAAVRGASAALERYEHHRADLRDRLGLSPGDALERIHRQLLHADRPVREGLLYEPVPLIGRDDDLRRLLVLVNTTRVVSIVGPGGLGKTRLAHLLGRSADQPVVHFVGLVGVTSPDDVVGEVGSALGVRDSVHGRRALTPEQLRDVRARVAQRLAAAPSLLILDNCEHVVDAVADLVAFLVATTGDLRVVTTSRAPLAIGAERVYLLGALGLAESIELFRARAVAARPDVQLPADAVTDIVTRLDGLPLAIELAAAKARAMSVEEIRHRLVDRFALLRGGVRNAPDRHRTLLAVIDWSWNLLAASERHALCWLSVFRDGVTLAAAEEVLGPDALGAVQALVDQSLLTVLETDGGVRYRMLETVREFGRLRLAETGETRAAEAARDAWAIRYASAAAERVMGRDQFAAIDALVAEEGNLADVLRQALGRGDPAATVALLCGLGGLWSVRGEHTRVATLSGPVAQAIAGWQPPAQLAVATRAAMVIVLQNAMIGASPEALAPVREMLARLGGHGGGDPRINAMATVLLAFDPTPGGGCDEARADRLTALTESADPSVAAAALQWHSHLLENAGDPRAAIDAAERALSLQRDAVDGPWAAAMMRTHLAGLYMQLGRCAEAVAHAHAAIPVLERLGALDDLLQLYAMLAMSAVAAGGLDDAAALLARADRVKIPDRVFGSRAALGAVAAELALARGDIDAGLAAYLDAAERLRAFALPGYISTGGEPWTLSGDASLLTALAYHAAGDQVADGEQLYESCRERALRALRLGGWHLDFPVCGMVMFAMGSWTLLRHPERADDAARLLVLADRFAYNRVLPTMAWDRIASCAEQRAPGRLDVWRAEYRDRVGSQLAEEAERFLRLLDGTPTD